LSAINFISDADKNLALNGSGKFHCLTYFICKKIDSRLRKPYTIIHIDKHSDGAISEFHPNKINSNIYCGNFHQHLMNDSEFVQAVVFIKDTEKEQDSKIRNSGVVHSINEKGTVTLLSTSACYDASEIADRVLRRIRTKDIYITLDLDILHSKCIETDYKNGSMSPHFLQEILKSFKGDGRLLGADICGLKRSGADIKSLETYASVCSTLLELFEEN
jgi:arginase family enzyme